MLASEDRFHLAQDLHTILRITPGLTKYQLRDSLDMSRWAGVTKSDINSVLYSSRSLFRRSDDSLPRWYAIGAITIDPILPPPLLEYYEGPEPRDWQLEAFDAWRLAGHRGVIEAVTGTGKTTVGNLGRC